ncbi:MAG TPA: hypothetical protein RMH85_10510 [Polyangiaceae bacterium LLY-WYZ-15_(1-7)]|nr:hypothetical protein [Sandaracinus sp.]HJL00175.1 hypothetical protein [Polyangiaceae bacterium LLY-WYZ-15_(1-7)]HJL08923.1 hypothetical protein [Polyangiaceae bacterium LLY-WYZ-15_(1-7)]HJL23998.1 hypothetical protein [Polyangiaceae bacterium LLY-WYZ-15_(1-7)]
MRNIGRQLFAALLLSIALLTAAPALADALVVVEVRTPEGEPADGRVTLAPRSGEGQTYSCTTQGGTCRMDAVAGGMYVVRFAPRSGEAPAPRNVVIPPDGRVTLRVATR